MARVGAPKALLGGGGYVGPPPSDLRPIHTLQCGRCSFGGLGLVLVVCVCVCVCVSVLGVLFSVGVCVCVTC